MKFHLIISKTLTEILFLKDIDRSGRQMITSTNLYQIKYLEIENKKTNSTTEDSIGFLALLYTTFGVY